VHTIPNTRNDIMTPLIPARRAAEEFARVVDGSQVDVADRFADLTATVETLRAQEIPAPRAEFVAELRTRLMAAADTLLVPAATKAQPELAPVVTLSPSTRRHQRRLATAVAAFVVVGGTAGVAAAAQSALPGDALYPIKRGIESAQVSFSSSDADRGRDLVAQASTRLDEVDGLISAGDSSSQITHTLASFERSATNGSDLLFVAFQRGGGTDDLSSLRATFEQQSAQLDALSDQAPADALPSFKAARALLSDLDQQARVLCGNCGPDSGVSDFANLSSAPALDSLFAQPANAAAADAAKDAAEALANAADEIASQTPKTSTSTSTDDGGTLPNVQVPSLPTDTESVDGTVNTVTGGVEELLDQAGTATGLEPVTTTVNNTLNLVTGLLTSQ
jgi:hypothetical protein